MRIVLILVAAIAATAALPAVANAQETPFPVAEGAAGLRRRPDGDGPARDDHPDRARRARSSSARTRSTARPARCIAAKDVKYFYVTIPNQPNVKLSYNAQAPGASPRMPWSGTWTVPAAYPLGLVDFKILIKLEAKRKGQFVQMPVSSSQLTVTGTTTTSYTAPVVASPAVPADGKLDVGALRRQRQRHPPGRHDAATGRAARRPTSSSAASSSCCARGARRWRRATSCRPRTSPRRRSTVPGVAPVVPELGRARCDRPTASGSGRTPGTSRPPSRSVTRRFAVTFTLDSGKIGTYDYVITIIP